jgi:hypothetical protein
VGPRLGLIVTHMGHPSKMPQRGTPRQQFHSLTLIEGPIPPSANRF